MEKYFMFHLFYKMTIGVQLGQLLPHLYPCNWRRVAWISHFKFTRESASRFLKVMCTSLIFLASWFS